MDSLFSRSSSFRSFNPTRLDYAALMGVFGALGLVFLAIYFGGDLLSFFDLNSFLIVVGGTIGATLINFPINDVQRALAVIRTAFFPDEQSLRERMKKLVEMSRRARADGLLVLQIDASREPDAFFRKCIQLVVDNHPAAEIRKILETEMSFLEERHRRGAMIFHSMGNVAPAMGLIGTLIGLVQMLRQLDDPSAIGPAMAVALLTTFYGAVLAYIVFFPLAGKLRTRSQEEMLLKELTMEGMLAISENINPRLVEERLVCYLPPEKRFSLFEPAAEF